MGTRVLDALITNLGSHPFVMFYAVVFWYRPIALLGFVVSGWVVARLHRRCAIMTVFAFLTTVLVRRLRGHTRGRQCRPLISGQDPLAVVSREGISVEGDNAARR